MNSLATASRSGRWPHVTAYWLSSALIAAHAASFTACGAAKSGNPCDRLTALCASLSRVISRMTDSVNCSAFLDPVTLDIDVLGRSTVFRLCSAGLPPSPRLRRTAVALAEAGQACQEADLKVRTTYSWGGAPRE